MKEICRHCRYKRFTCSIFRCDPYKEAELTAAQRRIYKMFPIEDYDGYDRYVAGEILKWATIGWVTLLMIYSTFKQIGEWWTR